MEDVAGKTIHVGLSGGVDSAVSAALLKRAGARVTGVFIKGWYPPGMPCTWAADRRDAMRVAARLRIPFVTLDASKEYKKNVVEYMLAEYRAGRTPNPDVMCNREVKFGAFYRYAKDAGADLIAMGHYRSGDKDQSYFLWAVPKETLAKTVFPVGDRTKAEVRALAKKFNLPVAEKRDSQGVCFLGNVSIDEFLRKEFGEAVGVARDDSGEAVGSHNGAFLYTIGERVALKGAESGPWFVIAKDIAENELTVGKTRQPESNMQARKVINFTNPNWLASPNEAGEAQCRYRGPRIRGRVESLDKSDLSKLQYRFITDEPLTELVVPGQSIVFYAAGELIGGGVIS